MPKVLIDGREFDINGVTDQELVSMIERTGATKTVIKKKGIEIKELSVVDPYTIGIGIGAIITWIVYRVSQSQRNEFKNMFTKRLE